jgi:PAT family beta-lactamase induction signal transducer AmpG
MKAWLSYFLRRQTKPRLDLLRPLFQNSNQKDLVYFQPCRVFLIFEIPLFSPSFFQNSLFKLLKLHDNLFIMIKFLSIFQDRRMLSIFLLGFSSGLPLALLAGTLQAWMAGLKVDLTLIGAFSLVGIPYNLKFLWAPFMDRFTVPFLPTSLGRRRGWIITCQGALMITIALMSLSDPLRSPALLAGIALAVAFCSASQDIVIDAYRTEILKPAEFGIGAAVANLGYRLAMLFSGAFALILSDYISWRAVYLFMAASFTIGLIASITAPRENPSLSSKLAGVPYSFQETVIEPFKDFFSRKKVLSLVAFIIFYKMDVVVAFALMTPFMLDMGFSKVDIGAVNKVFGLAATLLGTFVGGTWLSLVGIKRSLWIFGLLQGISGACFYLLARVGHNYPLMVAAIAAENFFSGMGSAAYMAFLMSLCNAKFTGTQYALLTSFMALTRTLSGAPTGWLAKTVGWENYFLVSILLMVPALILLTHFDKWEMRSQSENH